MEITITNIIAILMSFFYAIFGYISNVNPKTANPTPGTYANMQESPYHMDASGNFVANIPV